MKTKNTYINNLKSYFIIAVIALFSNGCSKTENAIDTNADYDTQITVNISGIEFDNKLVSSSINSVKSLNILNANTTQDILEVENKDVSFGNENLVMSASLINDNFALEVNNSIIKNSNFNANNLLAATSIGPGVKYRILLYDQTNPTAAPISVLGEAGTPLKIPVRQGKTYDWVAISNNDTTDPLPSYTATLASGQKDLLYAKGDVSISTNSGQVVNENVNIKLNHLLSRVRVLIDINDLPAPVSITNASISFGGNYFHNGVIDVATGTITNTSPSNISTPISSFIDTEMPNSGKKYIDFYTAKFESINPFQVTVNTLTAQSNNTTKVLGTAQHFTFTTLVSAAGRSNTARINFKPEILINCGNQTYVSGPTPVVNRPINAANPLVYNFTYTNATGGTYSAYTSETVSGLTASIDAGTLANGAGSFQVKVTGTPTSSNNNIQIPINIAGTTCTLSVSVSPTTPNIELGSNCGPFGRNLPIYPQFSNEYVIAYTIPGGAALRRVKMSITSTEGRSTSANSFCGFNFPNSFYTSQCGVDFNNPNDASRVMKIRTNPNNSGACNNGSVTIHFDRPINNLTIWANQINTGRVNSNNAAVVDVLPDAFTVTTSSNSALEVAARELGTCNSFFISVDGQNTPTLTVSGRPQSTNQSVGIKFVVRAENPYTSLTITGLPGVASNNDFALAFIACNALTF